MVSRASEFQEHLKRMYILDYVAASETPKSVAEIAEGSIYSYTEIAEACDILLEEGLIENQSGEEYSSNRQTESRLQDDAFERITQSYDTYLERFAESNVISIETEGSEAGPYPLKSSVATNPESFRANYFGSVSIGIEEDHFLTRDNNLPSLADLSFRNLERLPILLIKILWVHISVALTLASIPPSGEGLEPRFCGRRFHVAERI